MASAITLCASGRSSTWSRAIPAPPARLEVGDSVSGEVEIPGDVDWYRLSLNAGVIYEFILDPDWTSGYALHGEPALYDSEGGPLEGTQLWWDWVTGLPRLFYVSEVDQEVFVEAGSEFGDFGGYILSAREVIDLIPGDATTHVTLELGVGFRSRIDHPADADWMRLDVEAGQTYRVDLEPDSEAPDWVYPRLAVYREDGSRISTFGPHFVAEETGTVYVAAEVDGGIGSYVVTARAVENPDTVPGDVSTQVALPLDGGIASRIDLEGDQDWFRIDLQEGITVRFDLLPDPDSSDPAWYSELSLRDAEGEPLAVGAGWSGVQRLYWTPEEAGTHFAAVSGWWPGDYLLRAIVVPGVEEVPGDVTTTATISPGETIQNRLEAYSDEDWFMVEAEAGTLLRATVTGDDTWSAPLSYAGISWYDAESQPIGWGQSVVIAQTGPIL
jgi:hypothetical protein